MKIRILTVVAILMSASALWLAAQQSEIKGIIQTRREKPSIAIIDFRGAGAAQPLMKAFNDTLWDDIEEAGVFNMVAKTVYPLEVPQRPEEFQPPRMTVPAKAGDPPVAIRVGPWLTDWSNPPVNTT